MIVSGKINKMYFYKVRRYSYLYLSKELEYYEQLKDKTIKLKEVFLYYKHMKWLVEVAKLRVFLAQISTECTITWYVSEGV